METDLDFCFPEITDDQIATSWGDLCRLYGLDPWDLRPIATPAIDPDEAA